MQGQTNPHVIRPKLQRHLRNAATDAERALWLHLRGRQLDACKFRRQHPCGDYILDFVCLERRLVIELDGGQHAEAGALARDERRTAVLQAAGFTVLRFWNSQVFNEIEDVMEVIWRALLAQAGEAEAHPIPTQPSP